MRGRYENLVASSSQFPLTLPLEEFRAEVTDFAEYLRSTPTAAGVEQVYYPGELEHIRAAKNLGEGIEVEQTTCDRLTKLAHEFGVEMPNI